MQAALPNVAANEARLLRLEIFGCWRSDTWRLHLLAPLIQLAQARLRRAV